MIKNNFSGLRLKYGLAVFVIIVMTFIAVILTIFFTVKPLMEKEEIGRISGNVNTYTSFYVDNTSLVRSHVADTLSQYHYLVTERDSLDTLIGKLMKVSPAISAIAFKIMDDDYLYVNKPELKDVILNSAVADSLQSICLATRSATTRAVEYNGKLYFATYSPVYDSYDIPVAICMIAFHTETIYDRLMKFNPYEGGELYLISETDDWSVSRKLIPEGSDRREWLAERYGKEAIDVIDMALKTPNKEGFTKAGKRHYLYAKYDNLYYYLFFYAVDKRSASRDIRFSFFVLLFVCIGASILIIATCLSNMRRLSEKSRTEAQSRKDIETAASIQQSMLPKDNSDWMSIDIGGKLIPAKGVGGDLYYHWIRDGRLYFCIGDISGKGIPASLYMSKTISLFHIISSHDYRPSVIAEKLNAELCLNNENAVFLTLFIGVLDLKTLQLAYCNAGHCEPICWDGNYLHDPVFLSTSDNCPIGFEEDSEFSEGSIQLSDKYLLVFYTDGINEAKDDSLHMYGLDRLLNTVKKSRSYNSAEINEDIVSSVNQFVGAHEQSDDITLLTFRHQSKPKTLTITNSRKQLRKINEFLKKVFSEIGLDSSIAGEVRLGIDEAVTNIVNYAYGDSEGEIRIEASYKDSKLIFYIIDNGFEFNPLAYGSKDSDDIDPDQIGGLGLTIVKSTFDELDYERKDGRNILKLTKHV